MKNLFICYSMKIFDADCSASFFILIKYHPLPVTPFKDKLMLLAPFSQ